LDLVRRVLAIELMCAAQGVDQRHPLDPAPGTAALLATVRSMVDQLTDDRPLADDIERLAAAIQTGVFQ